MEIEEAVEQKAQAVVTQLAEGGVRLSARCAETVAKALIKAGWNLAGKATNAAKDAVVKATSTGRVSEAKLQSLGQDTHQLRLDGDTIKDVMKSLRKAGITYSVEPCDDGTCFIHFQGKDRDHLLHAVERAFRSMGIDFDPDAVHERTRDPAEGTDAPAREESAATEHEQARNTTAGTGAPDGSPATHAPESDAHGRARDQDPTPDHAPRRGTRDGDGSPKPTADHAKGKKERAGKRRGAPKPTAKTLDEFRSGIRQAKDAAAQAPSLPKPRLGRNR